MSILIFTTKDRPREYTVAIKENLEKDLSAEVELENLEDVEFITVAGRVEVTIDGRSLDSLKAVYIKHWHAKEEQAMLINAYLSSKNINVIPAETARIVPKTKLGETFLMALSGLPVPDSFYIESTLKYATRYDYIVEKLGSPFIFKAIDGKKGADNYLVKSSEEMAKIVEENSAKHFIVQKFIENDGDYRIINFEDEVKLVIHRTRGEGTHMNNTSQGGDGELTDPSSLNPKILQDSLAAAKLLGRDISGIDVVVDPEGNHYILEVNYSPQLTTGTFLDEKRNALAEYFKKYS